MSFVLEKVIHIHIYTSFIIDSPLDKPNWANLKVFVRVFVRLIQHLRIHIENNMFLTQETQTTLEETQSGHRFPLPQSVVTTQMTRDVFN